jgi:hypothetical protein
LRLLEMHQAGVLDENDLWLATLRSLGSSGLGAEAMEKVLSDFWNLASTAQNSTGLAAGTAQHGVPQQALCQRSPGWKNEAMLELLRGSQVRQCGPA